MRQEPHLCGASSAAELELLWARGVWAQGTAPPPPLPVCAPCLHSFFLSPGESKLPLRISAVCMEW